MPTPRQATPIQLDMSNTNPDGSPKIPDFVPIYDPSTMSMLPELNQKLAGIQLDKRALDQFRNEALRTGPSNWAVLARRSQALGEQTARERAIREAAAQGASARSNLAMRGGIQSGARERIAKQGMRDYLSMSQDLNRQGDMDRLQIGMNDESNRIQQLGMLPGMEVQALQPEFQKLNLWGQGKQFDVGNAMKENQAQNDYNQQNYATRGQMYGAKQQANAMIAAAPSCWLITGLSRFVKLPQDESELLTVFKHHQLKTDLEGSKFYIKRCGPLVKKMDEAGFNWVGFEWFNTALMNLLRSGELDLAYGLFRSTLGDLMAKYWPDCPSKLGQKLVAERSEKISQLKAVEKPQLSTDDQKLAGVCLQNLPVESFA